MYALLDSIYEFMPDSHRDVYFGPVKEYLTAHTMNVSAINAAKLTNTKGGIYKAYAVDCLPMRKIMSYQYIEHVNLWSLGKMQSHGIDLFSIKAEQHAYYLVKTIASHAPR